MLLDYLFLDKNFSQPIKSAQHLVDNKNEKYCISQGASLKRIHPSVTHAAKNIASSKEISCDPSLKYLIFVL
jgi:hypothetical protein